MNLRYSSILVFAISLLLFNSCYYDNEEALYQYVNTECKTTDLSFSQDIKPIVEISCSKSGCHDNIKVAGGITLTTYNSIKLSVDSGAFLGSILHEGTYPAMPLGGQSLPQCNIDQIKQWIDDGALNN